MLKRVTCTLLALVWGSQIPCVAGEGLGKMLLREAAGTGKGQVNKTIEKAAAKITGTDAATAGTAANKATTAAAKAGATADKATAKAGTSAAATTAKSTQNQGTLSKTAQDAVNKYGQQYVNKGQQQLDKLMTIPTKAK